MDEILEAEETKKAILSDISNYCRRNIDIWRESLQSEVNISDIKERFSQNFALIPELNRKWNSISKLIEVQKEWKLLYLNYVFLLKNEKIKHKDWSEIFLEKSHHTNQYGGELTPFISDELNEKYW